MMKYVLASLLLCAAASAAEPRDPFAFISHLSLAPDEKKTATLTAAAPFKLQISSDGRSRALALRSLDSIRDVRPNPNISWSADSKYLALAYNVDEGRSVVEVIDVESMTVVWSGKATSAVWQKAGHALLVVPLYPIDGVQETHGLLRIDPQTGRQDLIGKDHLFMGELDAGASSAVGRVVEGGSRPRFALARIDLVTGEAKTIP